LTSHENKALYAVDISQWSTSVWQPFSNWFSRIWFILRPTFLENNAWHLKIDRWEDFILFLWPWFSRLQARVIKPILGGRSNLMQIFNLKEFPYKSALFGLVSHNDPCQVRNVKSEVSDFSSDVHHLDGEKLIFTVEIYKNPPDFLVVPCWWAHYADLFPERLRISGV